MLNVLIMNKLTVHNLNKIKNYDKRKIKWYFDIETLLGLDVRGLGCFEEKFHHDLSPLKHIGCSRMYVYQN